MDWSPAGVYALPQIRTRVLNEEWENTFRRWHPAFRPREQAQKAASPHEISRPPIWNRKKI
jgi:hypothetical protein